MATVFWVRFWVWVAKGVLGINYKVKGVTITIYYSLERIREGTINNERCNQGAKRGERTKGNLFFLGAIASRRLVIITYKDKGVTTTREYYTEKELSNQGEKRKEKNGPELYCFYKTII